MWTALEKCRGVRFSAVCLGRPSFGVVEGADADELRRFVRESGKRGKKADVVREEETSFRDDDDDDDARRKRRPTFLDPAGGRKSEKPDVDGLLEVLSERYGESWAKDILKDLTTG